VSLLLTKKYMDMQIAKKPSMTDTTLPRRLQNSGDVITWFILLKLT